MSTVGPLQLRRRLYRDQQGKARLPLDEELQLPPRVRETPRLQEIAVELCSRVPFRSAAQLLRRVLPSCPSRVTLHRLLGQVGQQRQAHGERLRRRVSASRTRGGRRIRYLRANRDGLTDYRLRPGFQDPGLRGLGAAEGNVDKVVANRLTKRGMAWTFKGAGHMARVLEASHNGVLRDAIPRRARPARRRVPLRKFLYPHAANAALGADASSILHAPFVNRSADDFGRLLHRIGRPGTVWWIK